MRNNNGNLPRLHPNGTPLSPLVEGSDNLEDRGTKTPNDGIKNTATEKKTIVTDSGVSESSSQPSPPSHHQHHQPMLSVVSYNLLAPCYVRPIDTRTGSVQPFAAFEWVQDADGDGHDILDEVQRSKKLYELISSCGADVVCLQELQLDRRRRRERRRELLPVSDGNEEQGSWVEVDNRGDGKSLPESSPVRKEEKEDEVEGSNDEDDDDFVLPRWMLPLLVAGEVRDGNCDDVGCVGVGSDDSGGFGGGPYGIRLPPYSELDKIANRNSRVLGKDVAVTCAILYHTDKLEEATIVLDEAIPGSGEGKTEQIKKEVGGVGQAAASTGDTNTCVSLNVRGKSGTALGRALLGNIVVSSVHLDAKEESRRVGQLSRCLRRSRDILAAATGVGEGHGSNKGIQPISAIIGGDMNGEFFRGSCLHAFLEADSNKSSIGSSPTESELVRECSSALRLVTKNGNVPNGEQMQEWRSLHDEAKAIPWQCCTKLRRVDTGNTRAAYGHHSNGDDDDDDSVEGRCSNVPTMGQWRLDHILYTPSTLEPRHVWSTLEDDEESCRVGLPNRNQGSDHLPVGAVFHILPGLKLTERYVQNLLQLLQGVTERQKEAARVLQQQLEEQGASIEAQHGFSQTKEEGENSTDDGGSKKMPAKKKKKKKKGRPPPQVVEFLRRKRETLKALKASQKQERNELIMERSDVERLALEMALGYSASEWAERCKH